MINAIHSKDALALELLKAGLPDMAVTAVKGYYHDFLSPLDLPGVQLAVDLHQAGTPDAMDIMRRYFCGEFDPSTGESND